MPWDEAAVPAPTISSGRGAPAAPSTLRALHPAEVHQREQHGRCVITARGSFDTQSIKPLTDALTAAAAHHPTVILDASGVTFADSSFLNLLILTHHTGTLRLAAPSPQVRRVCDITGVTPHLDIRDTLDDALA
ncbi:STAS domain-containing protein [Streptomyces fumanus]|uniref:STAS domain-containing protein n=1 Tax=Streptomyces fumanus TaxID=67302 RepID=UPI00340CADD6